MKPFEEKGYNQYGASMGRRSSVIPKGSKVRLQRVPMTGQGDYDIGGAYWGLGRDPLYCAWDDEGNVTYLRAKDRATAKSSLPNGLRFYR